MNKFELHKTLTELQELQRKVDSHIKIWDRQHIETALCEEFHEWYNAIGLFKDWKLNKTSREKQLDELADCLAFTLSLLNDDRHVYSIERCRFILKRISNRDHKKAMLNEIETGYLFNKRVGNTVYIQTTEFALELILDIAMLYYSLDELFEAYKKKSMVNIQRQKEGY